MSILRKVAAAYIVTDESTGWFYIGSTGNIAARWRKHRYDLTKGSHGNKNLQRSFTSDSVLSLEIVTIGTLEEVRAAEQRLLDRHHGSELCCNLSRTSENYTQSMSLDERRAASKASKASPVWQVAIRKVQKLAAAANRGRTLSEEMLQKLADGRAKKPHPRLGKEHSAEQKAKYMSSIMEYRNSPEYEKYKGRVSDRLSKPISIEGVIYKNPREAGEVLGLNRNCVKMRLLSKNPKFKNWFRVGSPK